MIMIAFMTSMSMKASDPFFIDPEDAEVAALLSLNDTLGRLNANQSPSDDYTRLCHSALSENSPHAFEIVRQVVNSTPSEHRRQVIASVNLQLTTEQPTYQHWYRVAHDSSSSPEQVLRAHSVMDRMKNK